MPSGGLRTCQARSPSRIGGPFRSNRRRFPSVFAPFAASRTHLSLDRHSMRHLTGSPGRTASRAGPCSWPGQEEGFDRRGNAISLSVDNFLSIRSMLLPVDLRFFTRTPELMDTVRSASIAPRFAARLDKRVYPNCPSLKKYVEEKAHFLATSAGAPLPGPRV